MKPLLDVIIVSFIGADFEWSKTGDLRTEYMEEKKDSEELGNDLDIIDFDPQFQVWNTS